MLYVDTSALLKRYIDEPDSDRCQHLLDADPDWVTARHTQVEVRRNLARLLGSGPERAAAIRAFAEDWQRMAIVEVDEVTCESASVIAESTGARSLDALHLAAPVRVGGPGMPFLTFDGRQAQAGRVLGLAVLGV